jgi:hypothetical protein
MTWIEVEKVDLLNAVQVLDMVPQRSGVPASDYVQVIARKKEIELSLSSSVSAVVRIKTSAKLLDTDEPFFVDRRLFVPFVLTGKEWKGLFKMAMNGDRWEIRQGSRRAELSIRFDKVVGYSKWPEYKGLKEVKLSEDLRRLLLVSSTCASADPSMQHLSCVYIGGRLVLASNQVVLFVGDSQKEDGLRFPFPVGVIPLLGSGLVKSVGVVGELAVLDCGCGFVEGTVSVPAQKSFPRKKIIEQVNAARKWPTIGRIPAEKLSKAITRLVGYLVGVKREDWVLRLEMGNGKVRSTVRVRQGNFEEVMDAEDSKEEALVELPLELILSVVEHIASKAEKLRIRVDEKRKTPYLLSGGGVDLIVARKS